MKNQTYNTILLILLSFFMSSCEDYLKWNLPGVGDENDPDDIVVPIGGGVDVIEACDSFTWINGITYTQSNYTDTHILTAQDGQDSIVLLYLTINNSSFGTDSYSSCNSLTWIDGNTYTSNNNSATFVLKTIYGCDSTVTLDYKIDCQCSNYLAQSCSITASTTGQNYMIQTNPGPYSPGMNFEINMVSSSYNFGQAGSVGLYCNETLIHSFGSYLYFNSNIRTFVIPSSIKGDNCFTMRVTKGADLYVSNPFQIISQ